MNNLHPKRRPGGRRRGASLMVAVVLLTVTMALLLAAAKTAALHRRSLEPARAAAQADLLADAAARLATRRQVVGVGGETAPWSPDLPGGSADVVYERPENPGDPLRIDATVTVDGATARARRVVRGVLNPTKAPADRVPLIAPRPDRPLTEENQR